jgi:Tol biopolymer transport system component
MKKNSFLIVIIFFLSACASNTPQPNSISDTDQVATIVAGTLSASQTQTPPNVDNLSINGQLQGELAFIRNNNLWININGVENQITNDADPSHTGLPKLWYSNPQISPDGNSIAFLKNTGTDARTLMVTTIDGKNPRQLASDVAWTLPTIEWSNDNQKIYYASAIDYVENMIVKSIDLSTGELQEQGQFTVHSGCGGGSPDPADAISSLESLSPFGRHVFSLAPQNNYIMHSTACSGGGLGMLDLSTKQDQILDERAYGAVISPDGSRIAAASENNIVIFNVSTKSIENTFPTSEAPQSLLWASDGKELLYSTSKLANTLTLDDTIALDSLGSSPASFSVNTSTLWVISLENGKSSKIFEIEAHNLKPIFDKGQKALVVMVENANKLFDYVSQGHKDSLTEYYPTSNVLEVDLANPGSNSITNNTQQASFFK